jgi:hypothetical protein
MTYSFEFIEYFINHPVHVLPSTREAPEPFIQVCPTHKPLAANEPCWQRVGRMAEEFP